MTKKRYTRLEEEILQILDEKDQDPPPGRLRGWMSRRPSMPRPPRPGTRTGPRLVSTSSSGRRFDQTSLAWLGGTFGLALAAILVGSWSQTLGIILAIGCIAYFLSPLVRNRAGGPPPRNVQTWRGRDIELPPSRAGLIGDLRYRLWQMRQRR